MRVHHRVKTETLVLFYFFFFFIPRFNIKGQFGHSVLALSFSGLRRGARRRWRFIIRIHCIDDTHYYFSKVAYTTAVTRTTNLTRGSLKCDAGSLGDGKSNRSYRTLWRFLFYFSFFWVKSKTINFRTSRCPSRSVSKSAKRVQLRGDFRAITVTTKRPDPACALLKPYAWNWHTRLKIAFRGKI